MELGKNFNNEINLIKYNNKIRENINNNLFNIYKNCSNICITEFNNNDLSDSELKCLSNCFEFSAYNKEILNKLLIE